MSAATDVPAVQPPTQMAPAPETRSQAPTADETLAEAAPRRGFVGSRWITFSDNAIPSLVVAVIAGLMLYSLNETSDRITRLEERIDARFTAVDARFTKLEDDIDARFTAVDARFTAIDARFTKLEDDIDARFTAIDARFTKLEDDIDARFTKLEEGQHQIARTLAVLVARFEAGNEASVEQAAQPGGTAPGR